VVWPWSLAPSNYYRPPSIFRLSCSCSDKSVDNLNAVWLRQCLNSMISQAPSCSVCSLVADFRWRLSIGAASICHTAQRARPWPIRHRAVFPAYSSSSCIRWHDVAAQLLNPTWKSTSFFEMSQKVLKVWMTVELISVWRKEGLRDGQALEVGEGDFDAS